MIDRGSEREGKPELVNLYRFRKIQPAKRMLRASWGGGGGSVLIDLCNIGLVDICRCCEVMLMSARCMINSAWARFNDEICLQRM